MWLYEAVAWERLSFVCDAEAPKLPTAFKALIKWFMEEYSFFFMRVWMNERTLWNTINTIVYTMRKQGPNHWTAFDFTEYKHIVWMRKFLYIHHKRCVLMKKLNVVKTRAKIIKLFSGRYPLTYSSTYSFFVVHRVYIFQEKNY